MSVTARETASYLRTREAAERESGRERAARLLGIAAAAGALLVERHGAKRVWLFGSLVAGEPTQESDVDLAVEGLLPEAYFDALAELTTLFHAPVDLVRVEEAPESLRHRVIAEGREL